MKRRDSMPAAKKDGDDGDVGAQYRRMESRSPSGDASAVVATATQVQEPPRSSNGTLMSQYFHRNQTIEVLPRDQRADRSTFDNSRHSELFRTYTSSDLLNYRQRLLEDTAVETARRQSIARNKEARDSIGRSPSTPDAASAGFGGEASTPRGGSSWRLFYRNLPRPLRFRQNTRSTTRYIDPANAASLASRLRAKKEDQARENYTELVSPVAVDHRPMTDFERQMASLKQPGIDSQAATKPTTPKRSARFLGTRSSSLFSTDSAALAAESQGGNYRVVRINGGGAHLELPVDPTTGEKVEPVYASNEIKTSQYTWWSFVPVFLYLTFQKTANIYFLLIGIFQMIPDISPTDGVPLQFVPLAIVTIIDAFFAGFEDYKRHVADDQANSASTLVFNRELREFEEVLWRDIRVGDFLKVRNRETLPADLLILSVVPAEGARSGGNTGICYVETKNLDGETNLKLREAPQATRSMFANEEDAGDVLQGYVESELPNGDINRYSGNLYLEAQADDTGIPLGLKNVLLRGSRLRNTSFAYGVVVNTGVDTKIMMSSGDEFPVKISSIDEMTNRQVGIVVVLLVIMSLIGAIGYHIWMDNLVLPFTLDISNDGLIENFVYFFTTLASMVPITLYVSITLVKAMQAYFMESDLDMYDEDTGISMIARNMQLNEQLGQISHIFSDKTGTLTCNKMEFRKCSINGVSYGKGTTAIGLAARMRSDFKGEPLAEEESEDENDPFYQVPAPNVNFKDRTLWEHMSQSGTMQSAKIQEFFTHLALCHGVLIERLDEIPEGMDTPPIQYSASSPDEQALVCGAKYFGYEFVNREPGSVSVKNPNGIVDQYDILEVFEFDSTRKRMSVVVQRRKRDTELMEMGDDVQENVLVLTKGADSMLFPRLASDAVSETNARSRQATLDQLESFARDGLRTLVICSKTVPLKEWEDFHAQYNLACTDLREVEAKARGEKNSIDTLQDIMESNLELLGATAIEDRLQEGVPETMEQLAKAGICIWVLTGDMEETAINIGYACRLLNNDMERHVINAASFRTKGSILRQLDKIFHSIYDSTQASNADGIWTGAPIVEHALVIDGGCLNMILEDPLNNLHLLRVALLCKVVVACRVSPQQKAQLVELVKLNVSDSHTLSIGDGANDVPMIQSAHIGIGISGQEGMQAVNSSDYALGQFRFLSPLLLVHGRWNYDRVAALTVYTFYKNIVYNVSMFWYTLWPSAYSGTMIYSALVQQGYNLIFTALPILVYAVFDRDLPKSVIMDFPVLYHAENRKSYIFTYWMFWKWIIVGIIDSFGVYYAILAAAYNLMRSGTSIEYTVLETIAWTIMCVVVNARFCLMVNSWGWLEVTSVVVSILALYGFQYVIDVIDWTYDLYSFPWIFARSQFWFGQLFAIVAVLLKNFLYEGYRRRFQPDYLDLVKEAHSAEVVEAQRTSFKDAEKQMIPVKTELQNFTPRANNYLKPELANMMDYHERRAHERTPAIHTAAGREEMYRGFAFDRPAFIVNWILSSTGGGSSNKSGASKRKGVNVQVRQIILTSSDPVVFENERYQPFCGFGSTYPGYLLPTDRCRWSDRSGKFSAMAIPLAGLELNLNAPGCDEQGWFYENDFKFFPSLPPVVDDEFIVDENLSHLPEGERTSEAPRSSSKKRPKSQKIKRHGLVRRREWILSENYKASHQARESDFAQTTDCVHLNLDEVPTVEAATASRLRIMSSREEDNSDPESMFVFD